MFILDSGHKQCEFSWQSVYLLAWIDGACSWKMSSFFVVQIAQHRRMIRLMKMGDCKVCLRTSDVDMHDVAFPGLGDPSNFVQTNHGRSDVPLFFRCSCHTEHNHKSLGSMFFNAECSLYSICPLVEARRKHFSRSQKKSSCLNLDCTIIFVMTKSLK